MTEKDFFNKNKYEFTKRPLSEKPNSDQAEKIESSQQESPSSELTKKQENTLGALTLELKRANKLGPNYEPFLELAKERLSEIAEDATDTKIREGYVNCLLGEIIGIVAQNDGPTGLIKATQTVGLTNDEIMRGVAALLASRQRYNIDVSDMEKAIGVHQYSAEDIQLSAELLGIPIAKIQEALMQRLVGADVRIQDEADYIDGRIMYLAKIYNIPNAAVSEYLKQRLEGQTANKIKLTVEEKKAENQGRNTSRVVERYKKQFETLRDKYPNHEDAFAGILRVLSN